MKTTIFSTVLFCLFSLAAANAQVIDFKKDAFAHTYSIVARDTITGEMAVGVQSHWFSVGTLVPWGKSGVGVVATQSFVNAAYGPEGLALMEEGKTASEALGILVAQDEGKDYRQVAFLDKTGRTEAYTGEKCVEAASHITGKNFSVQANMMLNNTIVPAMELAYRNNADLPLAERVLKVLQAAQEAGGDIRGKQSAALIVVGANKVENSWEDKKIDLRVDDHSQPLEELQRLLKVARAYEFMNRGDLAMEEENISEALEQYEKAMKLFPKNLEMKYWTAVALANSSRLPEAKNLFDSIFAADNAWREMTKRLPASGLLRISEEDLEEIVN
jgi:uncharacterized Ntn-hydrolase superfamily protein